MIVFLNGAFGIGKTTVARALVLQIPRCAVYEPEPAGIALQRLARLAGRKVADFQDLRLWRRLTVLGIRMKRLLRPNVIVPMTFSNVEYLDEIRRELRRFDSRVLHFCLIAPVDVVIERLSRRRLRPEDAAWQTRRAAECCAVHGEPRFAVQVNATRSVAQIAAEIRAAIETS